MGMTSMIRESSLILLWNSLRTVSYTHLDVYKRQVVTIHPKKIKKFKDRIRELTPGNHGKNIKQIIKELNPVLRGWANYFRAANCKTLFAKIMGWIRRRLRMKQMREWKSYKQLHKALRRRGYKGEFKKISMKRWKNSASPCLLYTSRCV